MPGYPATPEGQAAQLRDVMDVVRRCRDGRGLGVFYWDATWTAVTGNGWTPRDPAGQRVGEPGAVRLRRPVAAGDGRVPTLTDDGHAAAGPLELSACLELLFVAHPAEPIEDRVARATASGIRGVEVWSWRTRLEALERALGEGDATLVSMTVDPMVPLVDGSLASDVRTAVQAVDRGRPTARMRDARRRCGPGASRRHSVIAAGGCRGGTS